MKEKNAMKTIKIIMMITGILTILLGVFTIVRPLRTFLSIGWILGALLLVNGIELVIASLRKKERNRHLYIGCPCSQTFPAICQRRSCGLYKQTETESGYIEI